MGYWKPNVRYVRLLYRINDGSFIIQHYFVWEDFQIVIDSDGTGRFWDFTGAKKGELRDSKETYECTSSDLEKFNQFMESIW